MYYEKADFRLRERSIEMIKSIEFINKLHLKIFQSNIDLFKELKGKVIFITGGTGFFGKWLASYLKFLNEEKFLEIRVIFLTRETKEKYVEEYPHIYKHSLFEFISGDLAKGIEIEKHQLKNINYVIHAATSTDQPMINTRPWELKSNVVEGSNKLFNLFSETNIEQFLFLSSGAVYGNKLNSYVSEEQPVSLKSDEILFSYAWAKSYTEHLGFLQTRKHSTFPFLVARGFTFYGPFMPLNGNYAAGNFFRDAIDKKEIVVESDGTALRSFMFIPDLVSALFHILLRNGDTKIFNVGSSLPISIKELAYLVGEVANVPVKILGKEKKGLAANYYVPETNKLKEILNFRELWTLREGLESSYEYYVQLKKMVNK